MSMLIIATMSFGETPGSGFFTKKDEPRTPRSSPENATNTTSRRSFIFPPAMTRAISRSVAVPDALSSAPG